MVDKVKRYESGMIRNPITLDENKTIREAKQLMEQYSIGGLPVLCNEKLVGIITKRDIRFENNLDTLVKDRMTSDDLITVTSETSNEEAKKITSKSYKELLRRMHVMQNGKVIDGAESFLIIWKNVPKYNFLYRIFKIKPLFFLLNVFYEIAAYFLFLKNKHLLSNEKK